MCSTFITNLGVVDAYGRRGSMLYIIYSTITDKSLTMGEKVPEIVQNSVTSFF